MLDRISRDLKFPPPCFHHDEPSFIYRELPDCVSPLGFDKYAFVALSRSFFSSLLFFLSLSPSAPSLCLCERRFYNECSELLVNFRLARGERYKLLIIVNGFINNRSCRSSRRTTRKYRACRGWFFKIAARAAIEKRGREMKSGPCVWSIPIVIPLEFLFH